MFTFSIRRPPEDQNVSEEIRREREATDDILDHSVWTLLTATLVMALHRPRRFVSALGLALRTSTPGLKGRLWALAYLCEAAYLARRLTTLGITHLHNHIGEGSASVAMLAGKLTGIPYSLTIHGPNEFDQPLQLALGEKIARSKFVVGISLYGRSQLFRWADFADWHKVHIVRCGVDEEFLDAEQTDVPDEPRLVCVGRLAEQKGQLLLIDAVAQLVEDGVDLELRLIGDGPLRPALERAIREHRLESQVRIVGWKSGQEVREEIVRSRALVLPSFAEGLPVVFMEALALQRPVISTRVAGIPELVVDGVTGWLTFASDSRSLADAMRECLLLPSGKLTEMGAAGARIVHRQHNAAREAAKLLSFIVDTEVPEIAPRNPDRKFASDTQTTLNWPSTDHDNRVEVLHHAN